MSNERIKVAEKRVGLLGACTGCLVVNRSTNIQKNDYKCKKNNYWGYMNTGDLLTEMVSKPQRESAGADSSSRFNYQRNWAFLEMLRKHTAGEDYLVAFEYHDDVVFFDSSDEPQSVDFCQVKTTKSITTPKKLSALTYRAPLKGSKTEKKNSIIGKLIQNLDGVCKDYKISLMIVSNAIYEFSDETIAARDLAQKYRDKLIEKVKAEFPERDANQILQNLTFVVTEIPLSAMSEVIAGASVNLFSKVFGDDYAFSVNSWIRLIQGEISRRNDYPSSNVKTVPELIDKKCVSRGLISNSLEEIAKLSTVAPDMNDIKSELKEAGWSFKERAQLDKAISEATRDYKNPNNTECRNLCSQISLALRELSPDLGIHETIMLARATIKDFGSIPDLYSDDMTLAAFTILVFYENA
jgi:hypothetical protein